MAKIRSETTPVGTAARVVWPLLVGLLLVACDGDDAPVADEYAARAARSEAMLSQVLRADEPGCSAAVGVEGKVVWAWSRGVADMSSGEQLTADTVFDIGGVSNQFTATAVLLLAGERKLSIDDTVSTHLPGLPAWAGRVTIDELMRHTSGIPNYGNLLLGPDDQAQRVIEARLVQRTTQAQILRVIATVPTLRFEPGKQFDFSNSNYILLAEIVARVSGTPLPQFLRERIFQPLGLTMELNPDGNIAGKAMSYRDSGDGTGMRPADFHWDAAGPGGIQATAGDLVRWGDNYRTGTVGGRRLLEAQVARPVRTRSIDWAYGLGAGFTYAAGIALGSDGTLVHPGQWEGFSTAFEVRPDRRTAIAVTCNVSRHPPNLLTAKLREIWT
jgi:CubicO group peptidase (beta-lactamase class C family)